MVFNGNRLYFKTLDLYKILNDRYLFLSQLTETDLLLIVENAFRQIKLNGKGFIVEQDRYRINGDVQVDFVLTPNDLLLSVDDFMAQLNVNNKFLKPDGRSL